MNTKKSMLVWFRNNLRTEDNITLARAVEQDAPLIPLFIFDEKRDCGSASRLWLYHALKSFERELFRLGTRLIFLKGDSRIILARLASETGAKALYWDRSYEPYQKEQDQLIQKDLEGWGIRCESFNDTLLFDPAQIRTRQGTPFKVFTAFWNHCTSLPEPMLPVRAPQRLSGPAKWPQSKRLEDFGLRDKARWSNKVEAFWEPGNVDVRKNWRKFLKEKLENYSHDRDRPALEGTSRLSPYLHFGEISVRSIWHEMRQYMVQHRRAGIFREAETFLRQIVWREFAHYFLFHFPETIEHPFRKEFEKFHWKKNSALLCAWRKGKTGYPIVDAGMRELWATGWMHNRVRMIVASFLVKDLLQPWQEGAQWFLETLVDADVANNVFGWQWTAGCGADAAPYFRIFNPILQGEKFDSRGDYVRRWVPELSKLPDRFIHKPWQASPEILAKAGIRLGKDYPDPVVDHHQARNRALFNYARMKK
ncbi:MAG TPA: deoxyribodipyrimidine photo-lyase [Candidatus Omnitrophota bacterium]|nr:deoxyribodipyrimidine photo-lyase [Candidatus Omnitrophota bacterium]